jgi:hypothetical protein
MQKVVEVAFDVTYDELLNMYRRYTQEAGVSRLDFDPPLELRPHKKGQPELAIKSLFEMISAEDGEGKGRFYAEFENVAGLHDPRNLLTIEEIAALTEALRNEIPVQKRYIHD